MSTPSCDPTLEGDKPPQTIDGWLQVFYRCEIDGALNGTPITITGFVTHGTDDNLPDQFYYVSRFFMSCCTVDTKPISLPVVTAGMPRPAADTWITVSGKLRMEKINGINAYVIVNAATEEIPQPDNPYEYLGQDY